MILGYVSQSVKSWVVSATTSSLFMMLCELQHQERKELLLLQWWGGFMFVSCLCSTSGGQAIKDRTEDVDDEDQLNLSLGPSSGPAHVRCQDGYMFFRLVEKSLLASHTFIGDTTQLRNVDFLAQPFDIASITFSGDPEPVPMSAVLKPHEEVIFAT